MSLEKWSTTAGSNVNANTGINWDEGMPPSAVNDSARSVMSELRDWYENAEWPIFGRNGGSAYSISFVSTTVFKFAGTDRRTLIPVGRRVKAGVGAGTIYGVCSDVTLSASDTQATITWDSGQLDSSLSYVALGVISPANTSRPIFRDAFAHFSNSTDPTKKLRFDCSSISTDSTIALTAMDASYTIGDRITLAAEQASTSGTAITFSSIPAGVRQITIMFKSVSLNGTADLLIQVGDSGGPETSGYLGSSSTLNDANSTSAINSTAGFPIQGGSAAKVFHGAVTLYLEDASDFSWVASGVIARSDAASTVTCAGSKSLSAELDRVVITTTNGTDTFDLGVISIQYQR